MSADRHIDLILEEIGQFGKFQKINYLLIIIPMALSATYKFGYVFTAGDLNYRCRIPECENSDLTSYSQEWTKYAIPFKNNNPLQCSRYAYLNTTDLNDGCSSENFDKSLIVPCTDGFIFEGDEKTIVNEWNITCQENQWKITLVGTMNSVGQFVSLPITGYLSDRYGRRIIFIAGTVLCGIFGLLRSLSFNYAMFVIFEFLDPALGSGFHSAAFILGMELVGPQYRTLGATLIACAFSLGQVLMGVLAMVLRNWRYLLQVTYVPAFLVIAYFWMVPESVRWLLSQGRTDEAVSILMKVAKTNKKRLSKENLQKLYTNEDDDVTLNKKKEKYPLIKAFKNSTLLLRLLNCSFCWLTNILVYYGLSLNAVSLAGNKFTNFIIVCLIELPGILLALFLCQKLGRKWSMFGSLILSGIACFASEFTPDDMPVLALILFLMGKLAITVSFSVLYVYTAEIFPTNLRHSLLGICSMFGRVGLMIAPQTPLLATYMSSLPLLLMGGCAFLSGMFVLKFPETLNKKLPDTIEEAVNI